MWILMFKVALWKNLVVVKYLNPVFKSSFFPAIKRGFVPTFAEWKWLVFIKRQVIWQYRILVNNNRNTRLLKCSFSTHLKTQFFSRKFQEFYFYLILIKRILPILLYPKLYVIRQNNLTFILTFVLIGWLKKTLARWFKRKQVHFRF